MQALSTTLIPCYAAADRGTAEMIAAFLERGTDVRVLLEDGEMAPDYDPAAKARDARAADIVLMLFSRNSLPPRWPRAQWEDALVKEPKEDGTRIAFVRLDDCRPPRVLQPQFRGTGLEALREIKRWVRGGRAAEWMRPGAPGEPPADGATELGLLGIAIADRPGCATAASQALAYDFARAFAGDFDAIFRLQCAGRGVAALAGDLAAQLGMRLEGELDDNLARLREFCSARRFLVLLDNARGDAPAELVFGGRSSTLIAPGEAPEDLSDPLRAAQHALAHADGRGGWPELCAAARLGRRLTRDAGRMAECYELMRQWHALAEARGDRETLNESAREMVWILEGWGRTEEASRLEYRRASEFDEQMMLPF